MRSIKVSNIELRFEDWKIWITCDSVRYSVFTCFDRPLKQSSLSLLHHYFFYFQPTVLSKPHMMEFFRKSKIQSKISNPIEIFWWISKVLEHRIIFLLKCPFDTNKKSPKLKYFVIDFKEYIALASQIDTFLFTFFILYT